MTQHFPTRISSDLRDRPIDGSIVIGIFLPKIHQDDFVDPAHLSVFSIMQDACAVYGGDNRMISMSAGAVPDEFMNDLCFYFVFRHIWFYIIQYPPERFSGNIAGIPNQIRSEEHTSELQSLMRSSNAVF